MPTRTGLTTLRSSGAKLEASSNWKLAKLKAKVEIASKPLEEVVWSIAERKPALPRQALLNKEHRSYPKYTR